MFTFIKKLKEFCKFYNEIPRYKLFHSCILGNEKEVKELLTNYKFETSFLNLCMENTTYHGYSNICKILIENGSNNIDKCLDISSKLNLISLIELFVRKGGNPIIPLTKCKSQNIINLVTKLEEELKNNNI